MIQTRKLLEKWYSASTVVLTTKVKEVSTCTSKHAQKNQSDYFYTICTSFNIDNLKYNAEHQNENK